MRPVARIAQSVEQGIENPRVLGSIPSPAPLILKNPPTRRVFAFGSDNNLHEKSLLIKSGGITLATLTRVILLILIS